MTTSARERAIENELLAVAWQLAVVATVYDLKHLLARGILFYF